MIWHESGGNQFSKDGAPLVSPKGAVGVAQVMEDTGPEAARLAGVEWDRDKWLNDPRYNAKLGQAYFGAQMKKYDNNPVLAVAAYNAGPGAVDGWIKSLAIRARVLSVMSISLLRSLTMKPETMWRRSLAVL